MTNHTSEWMKKNHVPLTRENYLLSMGVVGESNIETALTLRYRAYYAREFVRLWNVNPNRQKEV